MHRLVWNEWIKIFSKAGTYVMIGLIVLGLLATGVLYKVYEDGSGADPNWKENLNAQIEQDKEDLRELPQTAESMKKFTEKEIAINQYRVGNDLPPESGNSGWTFIDDSTVFISFAGLFTIIIAAGIVAREFSSGTIKLLLIRPIKRYKILLSKYITVTLFGLLMLAVLFTVAAAAGFILFGTSDGSSVHLAYVNGEVIEQSMFLHLIKLFLLSSIDVLMVMTLAFMISSVFRNSSLAIGISIFLLLTGGNVTSLLASRYEWAKYILFANTNLMQYFDGVPMVEGMTLGFSVIMLIMYFIIFQLLAFWVFTKRDINA
jgi:ABC-2 type transport system permease protein